MRFVSRFILVIMLASVFSLFGCGGGGGGSAPDDGTVTVKTKLDMTGTRAARAASSVHVTVYLADGTQVEMSSVDGINYEANITYANGSPIYIEARIDDIYLKQFIGALNPSGGEATLEDTTPETTLFADLMWVATGKPLYDLLGASNISSIVSEVQTVVANGTGGYSTLLSTYTTNLTWDNTGGVDYSTTFAYQTYLYASSNGISVTADGVELTAEAVATALENMVNNYYLDNVAQVAQFFYADGFLDEGDNYEGNIAGLTGFDIYDREGIPAGSTIVFSPETFTAERMDASDPAYSALSSYGLPMYRVYQRYLISADNGSLTVFEKRVHDEKQQRTGGIMQKINGSWYFRGNQEKAEYLFANFVEDGEIYFEVCRGNAYEIQSASVTINNVATALTPDSECFYTTVTSGSHFEEDAYINVTFTDGSTEQKVFTMPSDYAMTLTMLDATATPSGSDTNIDVRYSFSSVSPVDVWVAVYNDSGDEVALREGVPVSYSNCVITIPTTMVTSPMTAAVFYFDRYGRVWKKDISVTF